MNLSAGSISPLPGWRRGGGGSEPDYDYSDRAALDRPINDARVFHATVAHFAGLAGVDAEHLRTALLLGGVRGEPVTAAGIMRAAQGLRDAGYLAPPAAPPAPDPAIAAELKQHRRAARAAAAAGRRSGRARQSRAA